MRFRCESYNTAQIRLLHGDVLDSFEPDSDARSVPGSGLRSPSYGEDEGALSPALASLQINTSSVPVTGSYSRLNSPLSAEPNGQFASYSLSRDRAVSPVISNYFGLPPDRESERSKSRPHSGNGLDKDDLKDKDGEFHIWGAKLKYRYGFLGEEAESIDELSENDEEGYEEMSEESASEEEQGEEEEEEEEDGIDIFGHR